MTDATHRTYTLREIHQRIDWRGFSTYPSESEHQVQTESPIIYNRPDPQSIPPYDTSMYPPQLLLPLKAKQVSNCSEGTPHEVWRAALEGNPKALQHMFGKDDDQNRRCKEDCQRFLDEHFR
jgi:hypothetical protein